MENKLFENLSPNFDKALEYGFAKNGDSYIYKTEILNRQFELTVEISASGVLIHYLTDLSTNEPYTLHLVKEAVGSYVGAVRSAVEDVLNNIASKCFDKSVFKTDIARNIIAYVRAKYGCELEFLWEKFSQNAIWRRCDNNKWFGILLVVSKRKLGIDSDDVAEIIDMRMESNILQDLIDNERYFAGYHMNKKHWITMILDGSVPFEEICRMLDDSFVLASKK